MCELRYHLGCRHIKYTTQGLNREMYRLKNCLSICSDRYLYRHRLLNMLHRKLKRSYLYTLTYNTQVIRLFYSIVTSNTFYVLRARTHTHTCTHTHAYTHARTYARTCAQTRTHASYNYYIYIYCCTIIIIHKNQIYIK